MTSTVLSRTSKFVEARIGLPQDVVEDLRRRPVAWGFGSFSEAVYYRTYSRMIGGRQEQWADTIARVVGGVLSIRKDWYDKHGLPWDAAFWGAIGREMAEYMFAMKFLPPGRGLWAMGTDYVFERGAMPLFNCGAISVRDSLSAAVSWLMDASMNGVGVGYDTHRATFGSFRHPEGTPLCVEVPDSREGWVESVVRLIQSYEFGGPPIVFDYDRIRPAGVPLKGFGGVSGGADPLRRLHEQLRNFLDAYADGRISRARLIADVMNAVGVCVVSGNVRRSALLMLGAPDDEEFLNLKNYAQHPERAAWGWTSNNSVALERSEQFELLPCIAERIRDNGEPGFVNFINVRKYARLGKKKIDTAVLVNPCGEATLESAETCCLAEVFPTRCVSLAETWRAMELAMIYAHTVNLLPTHRSETNEVVARNRRVGISVSGIADWIDATSLSYVTMALRRGYEEHLEPTNAWLARDAGVPISIRLSVVKPSGTLALLAGTSPGMHWPAFRYGIRRMRVAENSPLVEILRAANIPHEPDACSPNTLCFEFPLVMGGGKTRPVSQVSVWEQASLVGMLQREWSDQAVSATLTFSGAEAREIERVLACFAPLVKSLSMLPDQTDRPVYAQPPYEAITEHEYARRMAILRPLNWMAFTGEDGQNEQFCDGDSCNVVRP